MTASAGFGGTDAATLATAVAVAVAAIISSLTPIALARRRSRQDALRTARSDAGEASALTLASWTALNGALQTEIKRLQGVVDRCQARVDVLEAEIAALKSAARRAQRGPRA